MLNSRGFRLSLFGMIVFLASLLALFALPDAGPAIGMMVGGMCVWVGFLWTLASFYFPATRPPEDRSS